METINSDSHVAAVPNSNTATSVDSQVDQSPSTKSTKAIPMTNIVTILSKLPLRLKLALGALGILIFAILLLIIFSLFRRPTQRQIITISTPSPEPTFSPIPRVTSEFAKSEQFMQFEENKKKLQSDTTTVDLEETNLAFPLLDMSVGFGQ